MKEKYYVVAKTITKWKLNNRFEDWLRYKADRSEFWKRIYVLYYRLFDRVYYINGLTYIHKEIDKQYPNLPDFSVVGMGMMSKRWLERDMIYSLHRYGINFTEYFVYKFSSFSSYFMGHSAQLK